MGQSLGKPFDVSKPRDRDCDLLRAEFRSRGLTVSKIDSEYRIFRVLYKPRRLIFLGRTESYERCRQMLRDFGK